MKNENLLPFERNNYFFGKLMTEREYVAEQEYFNNKRRLANAAFFGPGVVCGFTVTRVDGATIAVESGVALDGLGRELAAGQPLVTRLSELDGFAGDKGLFSYVYLCAEYAETPVEAVHAMTGAPGAEARHSRAREGVRLFLSYGDPEDFEIGRATGNADYHAESLDKKLERGARVRLYIARIHLVRWEQAYEIGDIDQVPFGQFAAIPIANAIKAERPAASARVEPAPPPPAPVANTTMGQAEVQIPAGAKTGSAHFSKEIPHGLGLVPVAVTLGVLSDAGAVFGDPGVFGAKADFDCAARVDEQTGTFRIGVKLLAKCPQSAIRFVWTAAADAARAADAPEAARIILSPSTARLGPLESVALSAELIGLRETGVSWSVREAGGGDVTRSGIYTAPVDSGVYTVSATAGGVSATALMIVEQEGW